MPSANWWSGRKPRFMEDRVGDQFRGLIISTTRFGFFVELEDLFVEGLVPIDTLPGDRYIFHENTRKIIGQRTRREFRIGDTVKVHAGSRRSDRAQADVFAGRAPSGQRKKSRRECELGHGGGAATGIAASQAIRAGVRGSPAPACSIACPSSSTTTASFFAVEQ